MRHHSFQLSLELEPINVESSADRHMAVCVSFIKLSVKCGTFKSNQTGIPQTARASTQNETYISNFMVFNDYFEPRVT